MAARPLASISRTRRPTATSALTAGLAPATLTTLGLLVARLVPARLTRAADGADVMGYPPLARLLTRIVPNMENRVRKCKPPDPDRKRVVYGKTVSVRVDPGRRRILPKKHYPQHHLQT